MLLSRWFHSTTVLEKKSFEIVQFAWVNYEASVIVHYVTVYGVARYKVLVCTRADKSTMLLLFCKFVSRYGRHQTLNHLEEKG